MARQDFAEDYARKAFEELLGRGPTAAELAQYSPIFMGTDKNIHDVAGGRAAVAQLAQAEKNDPAKKYAEQQAGYEKKAPEHYGTIDQMFQQSLGRAATDQEKSHFGSLLASGQVDAYGIGQFLNALPETVQKQDQAFRQTLGSDLQKQDSQYYQEQVLPGIQSQFAKQGRDVNSSAFANSAALAAQQQNRQREGFLSNLSAQQYAGSQGLAQGAYQQTYGNYQGLQDYSRQRSDQLTDAATGRVNELQNYNMQKQAYDDYLRRYGKRSSGQGIGALAGGVIGGGLGAYFGGPAGAGAGYSAGSGFGGGVGSMF